jgi:hypothetical protein
MLVAPRFQRLPQNNHNIWSSVQQRFYDPNSPIKLLRDHFTPSINYLSVILNSLAVLDPTNKFFSLETNKSIDKIASKFSQFMIPLSYCWSGIEALMSNKAVEAVMRFLPASTFLVLPFFNINFANGFSSGFNNLIDLLTARLGARQNTSSIIANARSVLPELKNLARDFLTKIQPLSGSRETLADQVATLGTILGNLGGILFARQERDSGLARMFGFFSNATGFVMDFRNIVSRNIRKQIVGYSCALASISNILTRFVDPNLSRILNHISIVADGFGLSYWAQSSKSPAGQSNLAPKNTFSTA